MEIRVVAYDHPDAGLLIEEIQREYLVRYGGPDGTLVDPAEFAPPLGLFLVGYVDGVPVCCGGWRSHRDSTEDGPGDGTGGGTAEVKRMYVVPGVRGRGLARAMLAELELTAKRAGNHRLILETGRKQPEAVALYLSSGYTPVPKFGYYADSPASVHLGKSLT